MTISVVIVTCSPQALSTSLRRQNPRNLPKFVMPRATRSRRRDALDPRPLRELVFDGNQSGHQVFADATRALHVPVDGLRGALLLALFEHAIELLEDARKH